MLHYAALHLSEEEEEDHIVKNVIELLWEIYLWKHASLNLCTLIRLKMNCKIKYGIFDSASCRCRNNVVDGLNAVMYKIVIDWVLPLSHSWDNAFLEFLHGNCEEKYETLTEF